MWVQTKHPQGDKELNCCSHELYLYMNVYRKIQIRYYQSVFSKSEICTVNKGIFPKKLYYVIPSLVNHEIVLENASKYTFYAFLLWYKPIILFVFFFNENFFRVNYVENLAIPCLGHRYNPNKLSICLYTWSNKTKRT